MTSDIENIGQSVSKLSLNTKIDPTEFDVTISALLFGLGAEKYIDIFRKRNIGQTTLAELTDEDLLKLGVDDAQIRQKILEEVQNLPIYTENAMRSKSSTNLGVMEIIDVLEESGQHLYRIYLSMLANTLALKKQKDIVNCLLYNDKYASDIALETLNEINDLVDTIDSSVYSGLKEHAQRTTSRNKNKLIIGSVGGIAIAVLSVLFFKSLKKLQID